MDICRSLSIYVCRMYLRKLQLIVVHISYFFLDPGARYYLNLDLCAFGGRRSTRDITSKQKRVYGPDIFVVDSKCSKVYYYVEWKEEWRKVVYHYMSKPDVFSEKDAKPSCKPDPRV